MTSLSPDMCPKCALCSMNTMINPMDIIWHSVASYLRRKSCQIALISQVSKKNQSCKTFNSHNTGSAFFLTFFSKHLCQASGIYSTGNCRVAIKNLLT